MSTGHDRNGGMFTPETERYSSPGFDTPPPPPARSETTGTTGYYDDDSAYGSAETTIFDSPAYDGLTEETPPQHRAQASGWHAGLDLGLLVVRLVLGGLFVAHGLQHLFGWFQGDGINGTVDVIERFGFHEHTTLLAWITGVTEMAGGTFVILGLATPAGAAAILGLMGTAIWVKFNGRQFAGDVELESIYAAAAFALLLIGPGRVSLDRPTPWYRYASAFGVVFFLLAVGAMITMLMVFR